MILSFLILFFSSLLSPPTISFPLNFSQLVDRVGPSVVNVRVISSLHEEENEEEESTPEFGSGFIVSPKGLILTTAHLVEGAREIVVRLYDGREKQARLVGSDRRSDLALLKIEADDLPAVAFATDETLKVGQWVVAIGSPFGFDHTVTAGIISAKNRLLLENPFVPFLQTDTAINPGNSGGPLFNLEGEVVGVNSLIFSRTGSFSGLAFAIPSRTARFVLEQLREKGKVTWGWIGVEVQEVDLQLSKAFGLEKLQGIIVVRVYPGSPAEKAGLRTGDVILRYNGRFISRLSDFLPEVAMTPVGRTISLLIWRWGDLFERNLKVAEAPPETEIGKSSLEKQWQLFPPFGVVIEESGEGLVVRKVVSKKAQRAGLTEGDLILAIADREVKTLAQLERTLEQFGRQKSLIPLLIEREAQARFLVIQR